mmetsp:Transcript_53669/g.160695  ORF Transcript_53669/g.160695 Transcript_53669/m.160695 type:complete len:233 (+) Transcript_53669:1300-1998(+)
MAVTGTASLVSLVISLVSLWPRFGFFTSTSLWLAASHNVTVLATIHVLLGLIALGLWYAARTFKRKSNIVDTFLREMFGLEADEDIGISVDRAAAHIRLWSKHAVQSSAIMCSAVSLVWHMAQPPPPLEPESPLPTALFFFCSAAVFAGTCCVAFVAKRATLSSKEVSSRFLDPPVQDTRQHITKKRVEMSPVLQPAPQLPNQKSKPEAQKIEERDPWEHLVRRRVKKRNST